MRQRIKSAKINLRDEIASIINKNNYFDDIFITVTDVEVSNDLRHLKVLISSMPDNRLGTVLKTVRKDTYAITKALAQKVKMKYLPKIRFHKDEGFSNYIEVEKLILNDD